MEGYEIIWKQTLVELQKTVSPITYSTYVEQLKPVDTDGRKLVLVTPSKLFAAQSAKIADKICDALKAAGTGLTDVKIYVGDNKNDYLNQRVYEVEREEIESTPLNPKYTFDTFVVGDSNRYLYAAAKAVAENPGSGYNPLFIYGGAGLGKTHIMHAIANYVKANNPLMTVVYATCEKFTSDLISNIRSGKAYEKEGILFKNRYRNVDVLLIDDIQFLAGKQATQEEFFHTFNELYGQNKQIVLTADCAPKELSLLSDRLTTRFECGLMAQVLPPDVETKIAILQKKAEAKKFILSPDDVINAVCSFFKISKADLLGKKKNKEIVEPRQICAYLMTELLSIPLVSIGQALGGRDHTTVIHARDKYAELVKDSPKTATIVKDVKNLILKK